MGGLRAGRRFELRLHRALRLAAAAGEPHRGSDSAFVWTLAQICGPLWGSLFLHLGLSFPSGRLGTRADRALAIAGYVVFPLAFVPALLFDAPDPSAPSNLLLVRDDATLLTIARALGALSYALLFVLVLRRSSRRWRRTGAFERLQIAPVYLCALLTFFLVTVAQAGGGDLAWWAAFVATALTPFAFLIGLLRSHVSRLDAELRERLEELRASRARLVEAGDRERRRLERDLHDGACSTALRRSSRRASPSCASSRAASTPRC